MVSEDPNAPAGQQPDQAAPVTADDSLGETAPDQEVATEQDTAPDTSGESTDAPALDTSGEQTDAANESVQEDSTDASQAPAAPLADSVAGFPPDERVGG